MVVVKGSIKDYEITCLDCGYKSEERCGRVTEYFIGGYASTWLPCGKQCFKCDSRNIKFEEIKNGKRRSKM